MKMWSKWIISKELLYKFKVYLCNEDALKKIACVYLVQQKIKYVIPKDRNVQETKIFSKSLKVLPHFFLKVAHEGILFITYLNWLCEK